MIRIRRGRARRPRLDRGSGSGTRSPPDGGSSPPPVRTRRPFHPSSRTSTSHCRADSLRSARTQDGSGGRAVRRSRRGLCPDDAQGPPRGVDPDMVGHWRDDQVWIGGGALSPYAAAFVPPHHDRVPALMDDVMAFARRVDLPLIAQLAVAHAQLSRCGRLRPDPRRGGGPVTVGYQPPQPLLPGDGGPGGPRRLRCAREAAQPETVTSGLHRSHGPPAVAERCWNMWSLGESNSRHPACKAGALPTELRPRDRPADQEGSTAG